MKNLPELNDLIKLQNLKTPSTEFKTLGYIFHKGKNYPITSIIIGSRDKSKPTFGLFGGVHGLERIGSQVIIAFLHTLSHQLKWDEDLNTAIQNYRIVCIPIINPVGMANFTRSNSNYVDLMRNAPVEAEGKILPLVSGHRISPLLPWYRGKEGVLEKESEILINFVKEEMFYANISLSLDVHSGFGVQDQIWYPFAKTKKKFPRENEALKIKELLDQTYPNHIYRFEPQSKNYLTHGDLWDYLFDLHSRQYDQNQNFFMPLTLELGSWNWIRKNPLQFFSKLGLFHPLKEHRHARIMRRHIFLIDFLIRAVRNHPAWLIKS